MELNKEHIAFSHSLQGMLGDFSNRRQLESYAKKEHGIDNRTLVKELSEWAIVEAARSIALGPDSPQKKYQRIVELYHSQTNLSFRTSTSTMLQQYSTPAPIAFLAGWYAGLDKLEASRQLGLEPSAGNGLLTIAAPPKVMVVNEIDAIRRAILKKQDYFKVLGKNATDPVAKEKAFAAVITNPPFGKLPHPRVIDQHKISTLDHWMVITALKSLKDQGRAALIIGGHTTWDQQGRIQQGKNRVFFNYLYKHFQVDAVINIDGSLYARQGTSFDVRLILIKGRRLSENGVPPLRDETFDQPVASFDALWQRVQPLVNHQGIDLKIAKAKALARKRLLTLNPIPMNTFQQIENPIAFIREAHERGKSSAQLIQELVLHKGFTYPEAQAWYQEHVRHIPEDFFKAQGMNMAYTPAAGFSCFVLKVDVPDSMAFETHAALDVVKQKTGGDLMAYVQKKLAYLSKEALCNALAAEQIDGVALAIFNIEERRQGMIIGDQTGIGKGRQAAAMIRYGIVQGKKPIFLSEKPNLFTDMYRDLVDIDFTEVRPFIVNSRGATTHVKDVAGTIVHKAPEKVTQSKVIKSGNLEGYDCVFATYSQFASSKPTEKQAFLYRVAKDNILVMDESHNASGSSATGEFMQSVLDRSKGVLFLSATFAKRPDNMPIYARKTAIQDANLDNESLVAAIESGGIALQEVLSSQLVSEGQMLRRERGYEGIEVNYLTLDEKADLHTSIADNITSIMRDIVAFQEQHISGHVKKMDKAVAAENKEIETRKGTHKAGVNNSPYFSKLFNVINQMLFSVKAEEVAERSLQRLKEGKKVVIAFSSTMGAFIDEIPSEQEIYTDFTSVLERGLDSVLKVTQIDGSGNREAVMLSPKTISAEASEAYDKILRKIQRTASGISISPIDIIIDRLESEGYRVGEVTGRKKKIQYSKADPSVGVVLPRERYATNDAFRDFNNNKLDVLMINQSGSTGASAHAIPTDKVDESQVKQRVMIILQAELDINREIQKRGRIHRTGQIIKPIYDYVHSAIPAEKRLMMMLQRKLKSLDANTSSDQKSSEDILKSDDFLNKYGDKIVGDWLLLNPDINKMLGDPLRLQNEDGELADTISPETLAGAASKVSGRVAILPSALQERFYQEVIDAYRKYVKYLIDADEYDLEVQVLDLKAEVLERSVKVVGKSKRSVFGDDSVEYKVMANVLKKPYKREEISAMIQASLTDPDTNQTLSWREYQQALNSRIKIFFEERITQMIQEQSQRFQQMIDNYQSQEAFQKLAKQHQDLPHEQVKSMFVQLVNQSKEAKIEVESNKLYEKRDYLYQYTSFFYPGKACRYTKPDFNNGSVTIDAVFVGFGINESAKNPYAPSQVDARFAFASSDRYLALPLSGETAKKVDGIIRASVGLREYHDQELLSQWDQKTAESAVDRKVRYILGGNLLQSVGSTGGRGKLISYTTIDGKVKKGILLPETYSPTTSGGNDRVSVPISRVYKLIKNLAVGSMYHVSGVNMYFTRRTQGDDRIFVSVPASAKQGGKIYKDEELIALVEGQNFEMTADRMVAYIPESKVKAFTQILEQRHGASLSISRIVYQDLEKDLQGEETKVIDLSKANTDKPPLASDPQDQVKAQKLKIARARALARKRILLLKQAA